MSDRIFPKIKFVLALLFFTLLPVLGWQGVAQAGHTTAVTDSEADRLIYYWDLRSRDSFVQVTNTDVTPTRIHVQIFDTTVGANCAEFDFFDDLTAFDTHVYDVSSLTRNNGVPLAEPDLSNGHGIVAITTVNSSGNSSGSDVLTGNFRIRSEGFEYRTNAAGVRTSASDFWGFNFNDVDSSTLADVVLVSIDTLSSPGGVQWSTEDYLPTMYDENENPISCPEITVECGGSTPTPINYGLNQLIINSRGGPSLCLGSDPRGHVVLESGDSGSFVAVFVGLNNGDGTGSMDSAVEIDISNYNDSLD